ncbi:MAG: putative bifunctional diguanylate cyclase/phosphodiesterase [Solirubrobacterales bacterium]
MTDDHPSPPDDLTAARLLDLTSDLLCVCRHGTIAWVNAAGARLLGEDSPARVAGRPFTAFLHPDHAASLATGLEPLAADAEGSAMMLRRSDGETLAVMLRAAIVDPGVLAIQARDLSDRFGAAGSLVAAVNRLEERAHELTRLSRLSAQSARVFETASEGIMVLDADLRITAVNPAFSEITGWSAAEMLGRKPPALTEPDSDVDAAMLTFEGARTTGRWQGERWSRRKDGEPYAERVGVSTVQNEDGRVTQYVVVFSDITARKVDEERVRRQANYDALTGLPNRALFLDRLAQTVRQAERAEQMVGLMFIDLDGFKLVNDTLGHDMGDLLLQEAANRLAHCVRAGDTVARLGGDEFTVLMPNLGDYRNAPAVAGRILEALRKPFELAGREAFVSGSIGITVFPDDARDAATMLKNADAAMYRAKEQGKANFQFFTADMNAAVEERLAIKDGLLKAFERDELMLYFQPKLDLKSGTVSGVEALLRWQAAELGMVSPSKFIPVMEESGLIGRVGEWSIEAACRQYRAWSDAGLAPLPRIAINLSVRQLRQPGFVERVERILADTGVSADALEFEVTEGMVMKDAANAVAVLRHLSSLGIRLAMDDFGTGTSSLSVLKRLPVDTIKIDRSFIADIGTDADCLEIIRTVISMGHSLRRRVVAEGVESREQLDILKNLGCDEVQGYVLTPPLPAAELGILLGRGTVAFAL